MFLKVLSGNLSETDLTLEINLDIIHTEVEFVDIASHLIIHKTSFILCEGQVDYELRQVKGLIIYQDVKNRLVHLPFNV